MLVVSASIVALNAEQGTSGANIETAGDALWWAFSTVTGVGYGDKYPVTTMGRLAGIVLMTAGVGLFGIFTAFVATKFMEPAEEKDVRLEEKVLKELGEIRKQLDEIQQK